MGGAVGFGVSFISSNPGTTSSAVVDGSQFFARLLRACVLGIHRLAGARTAQINPAGPLELGPADHRVLIGHPDLGRLWRGTVPFSHVIAGLDWRHDCFLPGLANASRSAVPSSPTDTHGADTSYRLQPNHFSFTNSRLKAGHVESRIFGGAGIP